VDDSINNDIDDKTVDVKSEYDKETLEDVVDGNVIKAKDTEKWSESVEVRKVVMEEEVEESSETEVSQN
jgi:hypothetical protein